jgi:hypothetical protein
MIKYYRNIKLYNMMKYYNTMSIDHIHEASTNFPLSELSPY